jgi:hypothetical protein
MTSSSKFLQPDEGRRTVYDNKKRTKRQQAAQDQQPLDCSSNKPDQVVIVL